MCEPIRIQDAKWAARVEASHFTEEITAEKKKETVLA